MGGVFFNDALGSGGRLGLSGVVTPDSGPDLAYGAVSIDQPLGGDGLRLFATASYSATRPSQALRALDTEGKALNVEAALSYPLIRSRDLNLLLRGGFAWRDVRSENAIVVPLFDDHVRSLELGVYANALDRWGGYSTAQATLVQGLSLFGATSKSAPDKSHATASGVFTRLDVEATRQQPLSDQISLLVGAGGQTAFNGSLLASEQYSIGGYNYGRAFDPADATGDSALAGRVELQWTPVFRPQGLSGLQPYTFYEHGQVWQAQPPLGTPTSQTLVSAGLGLRFTLLGRINSDLQWAYPLGPGLGGAVPRRGRVFFSVNTNF
ncbi:MAG: ShlB/FhaC/HecB family hemolysin secretion/activation protein [Caulobacteraceae bacterium]